MLRQIFRNRGAYNFVNVPVVASQDDPNGNRADYSLDWRRQYQPAQQEFREDVGCKFHHILQPTLVAVLEEQSLHVLQFWGQDLQSCTHPGINPFRLCWNSGNPNLRFQTSCKQSTHRAEFPDGLWCKQNSHKAEFPDGLWHRGPAPTRCKVSSRCALQGLL